MSLATLGVDQLSLGRQKAKELKRKGIKSPKEINGIRLDAKTIVYPKTKLTSQKAINNYIEMKRKQLNLR